MGITNKFEAGVAGVILAEALVGVGPVAAQKQGYNRQENEQYGGTNKNTLQVEQNNNPQIAHIETREGKLYLVVPGQPIDKPQTNPHNFPQPPVPGDTPYETVPGAVRAAKGPEASKEQLQQKEKLMAEATIGLTTEQIAAIQQVKPDSLLGKSWYDLGFHVRLDEQGNIVTDLPAALFDPNTELGKYLINVVLPDAAMVLSADKNTSKSLTDGNDTVFLVLTNDESSPTSAFVSPTIEIKKFTEVDGVPLTPGSRLGYTQDGQRLYAVNRGEDMIGVTKLTDPIWTYLHGEGTFDADSLPPMGDRLFVRANKDGTLNAFYTPDKEFTIPTSASAIPTDVPKNYAKFGEKAVAGASLNVEHVANDQIPAEVLNRLKSPWAVRIGDTGWILDYSKAKKFQAYVHTVNAQSINHYDSNGFVYMAEADVITQRFATHIKEQLTTPEYQNAHIFAISPNGSVVEVPKFTPDNLPIVIVETHDWTDLGNAGNPKGEQGKTAFQCPNNTDTFVRYWDPIKKTLTVKRYLAKGQNPNEPKNTGGFGESSQVDAAAIQWAYMGSLNLEQYWTQWAFDTLIYRIPNSQYAIYWIVSSGTVDTLKIEISKIQQ